LPGLFGDGDVLPNTPDWLGRFRMAQNPSNDHMLSREAQKTVNFTGIMGGRVQDQAIVESMGPLVDRTGENLGSSDQMIIRTRRRLLRAVKEMREKGAPPPGANDPLMYSGVRSGHITLPAQTDWLAKFNSLRREWGGANVTEISRAGPAPAAEGGARTVPA
jgi:hypothetical protein